MSPMRLTPLLSMVIVLLLAGCATRPVNPPITQADPNKGYRYVTRAEHLPKNDSLVILAFSGGGTRAAAFSYGALEALRDMEVTTRSGRTVRVLDTVDVITGI